MAKKSRGPRHNAPENAAYTVGYCKPPLETRFKEGETGNRNGRPKKDKTLDQMIATALARKVVGQVDGKSQSLPTAEAIVLRLTQMALKCDLKAIKFLLSHAERSEATAREEMEGQKYGVLVVAPPIDPANWELAALKERQKHPILGPMPDAWIEEAEARVEREKGGQVDEADLNPSARQDPARTRGKRR